MSIAPPDLPRPRDDLAGFAPYRTQQMAADVRLHANEWTEPNPAGKWLTSPELDAVLLNRYPTPALELRHTLARRYGVLPDQLIFGNGSNEVLLNTFLVFGGRDRRTLLFQPTYSMHHRLAIIAGGEVANEVVGLPYQLDAPRALDAAARARPDIVVFTNPNNPTGNEIAPEVILAVARAHPRTLVLVDEAYAEFAGTTLVPRLVDHPNVVVSKTFSKVHAAAGLRLGILIAHPELVDLYRAVQLPYNLSAITLAVASKIAKDELAIDRRVAQCATERARVYSALQQVPAVEAFRSVTNFILFRMRDRDAAAAHARFLAKGVLIRDISSWPGCDGCLRVSIGTASENDRFIAAIPHALAA